eukprot:m.337725 g.337725  ORF g.337725 m.337725 type:complete len:382 (-) comp16082_c1_seq2:359-1504(-)
MASGTPTTRTRTVAVIHTTTQAKHEMENVDMSMHVRQFKQKLADEHPQHPNPSTVRLVCAGKMMLDSQTLEECTARSLQGAVDSELVNPVVHMITVVPSSTSSSPMRSVSQPVTSTTTPRTQPQAAGVGAASLLSTPQQSLSQTLLRSPSSPASSHSHSAYLSTYHRFMSSLSPEQRASVSPRRRTLSASSSLLATSPLFERSMHHFASAPLPPANLQQADAQPQPNAEVPQPQPEPQADPPAAAAAAAQDDVARPRGLGFAGLVLTLVQIGVLLASVGFSSKTNKFQLGLLLVIIFIGVLQKLGVRFRRRNPNGNAVEQARNDAAPANAGGDNAEQDGQVPAEEGDETAQDEQQPPPPPQHGIGAILWGFFGTLIPEVEA